MITSVLFHLNLHVEISPVQQGILFYTFSDHGTRAKVHTKRKRALQETCGGLLSFMYSLY